ncbi:M57 family metalloprotease [Lacibacter sp. H407]|uniref:M57 family metalloprotease n=1 Tax=Lacibacter sp. H407 TaxID=3133423 RepID=UPI0030BC7327
MRKLLSIIGVAAFAALFIVACSKAGKEDVQAEVSQETLNQISDLGFSTDNVIAADGGFVVEGDIFLSPADLKTKQTAHKLVVANAEQYRTTNLVSGPRNITVSVSGTNLPSNFLAAVDAAIARYNAENLTLTFSRVTSGGNINIRIVNTRQYIASAGFPSGGNPYGTINYAKTYTTYSLNFMTTVLAHEIGHCIGFRHTDYMDRSYSCGGGTANEGASTVGAIHIPGTPTVADPGSWMLACLSASTNRPFNNNDKTALSYLY